MSAPTSAPQAWKPPRSGSNPGQYQAPEPPEGEGGGMTDAEQFKFDLAGFIVVKGALAPAEVAPTNGAPSHSIGTRSAFCVPCIESPE